MWKIAAMILVVLGGLLASQPLSVLIRKRLERWGIALATAVTAAYTTVILGMIVIAKTPLLASIRPWLLDNASVLSWLESPVILVVFAALFAIVNWDHIRKNGLVAMLKYDGWLFLVGAVVASLFALWSRGASYVLLTLVLAGLIGWCFGMVLETLVRRVFGSNEISGTLSLLCLSVASAIQIFVLSS